MWGVTPLPIYASLADIPPTELSGGKLTEFLLQQRGFSAAEIAYIKEETPVLLLLDGYEYILRQQQGTQPPNLYRVNHMDAWKLQLVITCDSSHLDHNLGVKYSRYFSPQAQFSVELPDTPPSHEVDGFELVKAPPPEAAKSFMQCVLLPLTELHVESLLNL